MQKEKKKKITKKQIDELLTYIPFGLLFSHGWDSDKFNKKYKEIIGDVK
jgi:hypothetical protein